MNLKDESRIVHNLHVRFQRGHRFTDGANYGSCAHFLKSLQSPDPEVITTSDRFETRF